VFVAGDEGQEFFAVVDADVEDFVAAFDGAFGQRFSDDHGTAGVVTVVPHSVGEVVAVGEYGAMGDYEDVVDVVVGFEG